jgi:hypothetical protein
MLTTFPTSDTCDVIGCGKSAAFFHAQAEGIRSEEVLCNSCFLKLGLNRPDLAVLFRPIQPAVPANTIEPHIDPPRRVWRLPI